MEHVTVVNRTQETLKGTWDGRHYTITPGKHSYPRIQAEAFQRQNPIMGSEDPRVFNSMKYKIGIEENGDDCTPLTDLKEGIERWDRSKLPGARPSEVVPGDNGLYSLGRTAGSGPLPSTVGFTPNGGTNQG